MIAHIRHRHTNYDEQLAQYAERATARDRVWPEVLEILDDWLRPGTREKGRD